MANEVEFVIDVGGSREILRTLDDVLQFLDKVEKKQRDLARGTTVGEAISGDPDAIRSAQEELQLITRTFEQFKREVDNAEEGSLFTSKKQAEAVQKRLKAINKEAQGLTSTLAEAVVQSSNNAFRPGDNIKDLNNQLEVAKESLAQYSAEMLKATNRSNFDTFESEVSTIQSEIDFLNEQIERTTELQSALQRGFSENFLVGQQDVDSLIEVANQIDATNEGLAQRQQPIRQAQDAIVQLRTEQLKLEEAYRNANDPQVLEVLKNKYDELQEEIDRTSERLEKYNNLQSQNIQGTGSRFGNAGASSEAMQQISGVSNSISALTGALKSNQSAVAGSTNIFGQNNEAVQENVAAMSDMFLNVGALTERLNQTGMQFQGYSDNLLNVSQNTQQWSNQLGSLGKNIKGTDKFSRGLSKSLGGLSKGLNFATKGLATAAKFVNVLAAVWQGIQVGFEVYNLATGRSEKQIRKRIDALKKEAEETKALNTLIRDGSVDAINQRRQEIENEIRDIENVRDALIEQSVANTNLQNQTLTITSHMLGFNKVFGKTADEVVTLNEEVNALYTELDTLSSEGLPAAIRRVEELNNVASAASDALDSFSNSQQELTDIRREQLKNEEELRNSLSDLEAGYANEINEIRESRDTEQRQMYKSHLDELESMETGHNETLRSERLDHLRSLEQMEDNYFEARSEMVTEFEQSLQDMETEFNESNKEAKLEFEEEMVEMDENYLKTLSKMEEDFNKERIKRQKALEDEMFEAELNNDALRLFMLMRQGEEEEKQAAEDFEERKKEEKESFDEAKADREEQYREAKADREEQYREQRQETIDNHRESMQQQKEQFLEQMQLEKDNFNKKMQELDYQYQQERSARVAAFEQQLSELEAQYDKEDAIRQENYERQRQELQSNFEAELEYFRQREDILMSYINAFSNIQEDIDGLRSVYEGESIDAGDDYLRELTFEALQEGINYLESISDRTDDEEEEIQRLRRINEDLLAAAESKDSYTLSDRDRALFQEYANIFTNNQLVSEQENFQDRLDFTTQDEIDRAERARSFGRNDGAYDDILQENEEYLRERGYIETEAGLATRREREAQLERQRRIEDRYGEESTEEIRRRSEEENRLIADSAREQYEERRHAENEELASLDEHFYERENEETGYYNASNREQAEAYNRQMGTQQAGQEAMNDQTEGFLEDEGTLREKGHDNQLMAGADNQEEQLAQDGMFNKERLGANTEFNEEEQAQNAAFNELKLELLSENQLVELEQYRQFHQVIREMNDIEYTNTMRTVQNRLKKELSVIINLYDSGHTGMINSAQQYERSLSKIAEIAANNAVAAANSASQAANSASRRNSSWWGSNSSSSSSSRRSSRNNRSRGSSRSTTSSGGGLFNRLFAAKGALIDEPTLMIAGEGGSPEVVMPFDESKGIPDKTLRQLGAGFIEALHDNNLNIPGAASLNISKNLDQQSAAQSVSRFSIPMSKPDMPFTLPPNVNSEIIKILSSAMNKKESSNSLSIGTINVGSNISRKEVVDQFTEMQKALVDVMNESING